MPPERYEIREFKSGKVVQSAGLFYVFEAAFKLCIDLYKASSTNPDLRRSYYVAAVQR